MICAPMWSGWVCRYSPGWSERVDQADGGVAEVQQGPAESPFEDGCFSLLAAPLSDGLIQPIALKQGRNLRAKTRCFWLRVLVLHRLRENQSGTSVALNRA